MDNKTFAHQWFEQVWNQQNEKAIFEMFADRGIAHGLVDEDNNEIVGPEKFSIFFKKFIQSFPDLNVVLEDTVSEGEKIASRCSVSFTHSGTAFQASSRNIVDPSSKRVTFTGMTIVVIRDGKIQEAWNNFDFLSMYVQMGVVQL